MFDTKAFETQAREKIAEWQRTYRFVESKLVVCLGDSESSTYAELKEIHSNYMSGRFEVTKTRVLSLDDAGLDVPVESYDAAFDLFDRLVLNILDEGIAVIPAGHVLWDDDESVDSIVFTPDP